VDEVSPSLPTKLTVLGNPKLVLRQMIECAKVLAKEPPKRDQWVAAVAEQKEPFMKKNREEAEAVRNATPINAHFLAQEIIDFLDDSATVIYDSFSGVAFLTDRIVSRFAGQILDAATYGGVGHSIGMGIGAQLGRPGKQVLSLIGDGGIGIAGFDLETAARYKIPAVWVVYNNSGWISTEYQKLVCPSIDSWGMLPDIRYDEIFERMGCHGEYVTEPQEIRPALQRAFESGKPSVINVIVDKTVFSDFHKARIKFYRGEGGFHPTMGKK
jgi:acetolactate synthase-1/2/3 large subunit